ncbi:tRNA (adenine22-N1)-methyltransferase [Amphritea atlantica]|uniref:tRNA (Adenine22-N1)-methyltransferase n=1 Tax=Amphritea atlantica TaxID=355243 RepID=A0A1H9KTI3_9GAMM|nr:tRNA (adenine(22)-N(1))-methyltransferase TrmK [Amphritea atlantica]SER02227.1 tRNA (adenine22-N1)-methyltransferase [Amphritea atlantica]
MKLSKRLQQIEQLVASDYDHIWDCCCDHGFLGAELLSRPTSATIHFVDIVPQLMTQLENRLRRFYPDARERWETHCIDVARLPLQQYSGKQLIIIAGVGGDLMIQFLEAIHQQHAQLNIDLLLCPVYQQYALREKLIELNCSLKDEILIAENQRFYEAILVSSTPDHQALISPVGNRIWHSETAAQKRIVESYLRKTLSHYQRIQQGDKIKVDHILEAYRAITL